jgi:hypothetical protein
MQQAEFADVLVFRAVITILCAIEDKVQVRVYVGLEQLQIQHFADVYVQKAAMAEQHIAVQTVLIIVVL